MYTERILVAPTTILQNPLSPTPPELADAMVMLKIMHHTFADKIKQGHIIVHRLVADDVRLFFETAFKLRFPIHSVVPVSDFGWNDEVSCEANNSSGHNMRYLDDGRMSKHGIGCAFDINPHQNPCYELDGNSPTLELKRIIPKDGAYIPGTPGTLQKGHPLVGLMVGLGWSWGGDWIFPKDYQHFQIVPPELAQYVR